jgi:hypothetical protein
LLAWLFKFFAIWQMTPKEAPHRALLVIPIKDSKKHSPAREVHR